METWQDEKLRWLMIAAKLALRFLLIMVLLLFIASVRHYYNKAERLERGFERCMTQVEGTSEWIDVHGNRHKQPLLVRSWYSNTPRTTLWNDGMSVWSNGESEQNTIHRWASWVDKQLGTAIRLLTFDDFTLSIIDSSDMLTSMLDVDENSSCLKSCGKNKKAETWQHIQVDKDGYVICSRQRPPIYRTESKQ